VQEHPALALSLRNPAGVCRYHGPVHFRALVPVRPVAFSGKRSRRARLPGEPTPGPGQAFPSRR
jgi:hypothetical protein